MGSVGRKHCFKCQGQFKLAKSINLVLGSSGIWILYFLTPTCVLSMLITDYSMHSYQQGVSLSNKILIILDPLAY